MLYNTPALTPTKYVKSTKRKQKHSYHMTFTRPQLRNAQLIQTENEKQV